MTRPPFTPFPAVRPHRPDVSAILPELLVGEYPNPEDVAWLRAEHGITAVLSLQDDADLASKALALDELVAAYRTHAVGFHHLPVPDGDTVVLAERLDAIVALLDRLLTAGERVYVHCNAGLNRAPTAAIAWLHERHGLPLAEARDFVKQRRSCVPYMTVLATRYRAR